MKKDAKEANVTEFKKDQNEEVQNQEPEKKIDVLGIIKAAGYFVTFALGVGLTLFFTNKEEDLDDEDDSDSDDFIEEVKNTMVDMGIPEENITEF